MSKIKNDLVPDYVKKTFEWFKREYGECWKLVMNHENVYIERADIKEREDVVKED